VCFDFPPIFKIIVMPAVEVDLKRFGCLFKPKTTVGAW